MNEEIKRLRHKPDFDYNDAFQVAGAAAILLIQLHYGYITENEAYDTLRNDFEFDDKTIEWIRNDLEKAMSKMETEENE